MIDLFSLSLSRNLKNAVFSNFEILTKMTEVQTNTNNSFSNAVDHCFYIL